MLMLFMPMTGTRRFHEQYLINVGRLNPFRKRISYAYNSDFTQSTRGYS